MARRGGRCARRGRCRRRRPRARDAGAGRRRTNPSALVGAPDAESSAWYCTGQSTAGGRVARLPRADQYDDATGHRDYHRRHGLGRHRPCRGGRPGERRGGPDHPRPVVGFLGVRERDHVGRRRGGVPDGGQFAGLVPGAVPEHDIGPVVRRRRLHRGRQRALRLAAQSHVDAGRGRSQLPDAERDGPPDQLPGHRAAGGSGGGRERGVGGAADLAPSAPSSPPGRAVSSRRRSRSSWARAGPPAGSRWSRASRTAGALDDPPGPGGRRRDVRGRRLQPGHVDRDGDGAFPPAVGPAGPVDRQGPARDDLGAGHQRADADPRRRDLRHLDRRLRWVRCRRGAHGQPSAIVVGRPSPA